MKYLLNNHFDMLKIKFFLKVNIQKKHFLKYFINLFNQVYRIYDLNHLIRKHKTNFYFRLIINKHYNLNYNKY